MFKYLLVSLILLSASIAEDGWLKKKIKERWIKKQSEQKAPLASQDIKTKLTKPGFHTFTLTHQEHQRYYKVYLPKNFQPSRSYPLVFAFHGGGGNMEIQSNERYYKLISKADKEGYALVFPNGFSLFNSGKYATWNAGACCAEARDQKIDDVGFVREVFQAIKSQVNIDTKKVFAIGMSNGAMLSYRLACEAFDIFKAIAAVAGTDNTLLCSPLRPVSILHIHARDDEHVLYLGGRGPKASKPEKVTDYVSVAKTMDKWAQILKCDSQPNEATPLKGVAVSTYKNCPQATLKLISLDKGGHSWPGGVKPRGKKVNESPISANEEIWKFFKELP